MRIGDLVTRKSCENDIAYCIIDFKAGENGECVAVLKALYNHAIIVEAPVSELENLLPKGRL
ncbi:MAG: sporulation peptidase YabG [Bacillota bacterium]